MYRWCTCCVHDVFGDQLGHNMSDFFRYSCQIQHFRSSKQVNPGREIRDLDNVYRLKLFPNSSGARSLDLQILIFTAGPKARIPWLKFYHFIL